MKRFHEAPIHIFKEVQQLTDGDYALVHLFETNQEYYRMFEKAVADGREVILDNSIFELGTAFDSERYAAWINMLKPTWYIVPDCWKNSEETIRMFNEFVDEYPTLPGKRIGVAQGNTIEEVTRSYKAIEPFCDMIAFNLDFASMVKPEFNHLPYCVKMSLGRAYVLSKLRNNGIINTDKPHHLLGCGVPQEMMWYSRIWRWLYSVDTSNPIVHGLFGDKYDPQIPGLEHKLSIKMCDLIHVPVSDEALSCILENISDFKIYCGG